MSPSVRLGALVSTLVVLSLGAGCKKSVGDLRTVDVVSDATGNPSTPAKVSLSLTAGELHLVPGGAHTLGGSVRSNVKDLDPKVEDTPGKVTVGQGKGDVDVAAISGDVVADWRLTLGPTPVDLSVDAKAAKTELDLSGIALKALTVRSTAGTVDLSATKANPMVADLLDVETGAGAITLRDVANVNATKVRVKTTAGAITLDMGKSIDREMTVDVDAGAGAITLTVPSTGALATIDGGCTVKPTGWDKVEDKKYAVKGNLAAKVTFTLKCTTGTITLNAPQ
jgi:DUF4097 and DUF4098 domain-containing protein YvlB